jgi:hypothetical protein
MLPVRARKPAPAADAAFIAQPIPHVLEMVIRSRRMGELKICETAIHPCEGVDHEHVAPCLVHALRQPQRVVADVHLDFI